MVEAVVYIGIQRLHGQQTIGQLDALATLMVVPALEVLGILIGDVEAEAVTIAVEIQLVIMVLAHQFGGIERCAERKAEVADAHGERRLAVGFHLCLEVLAIVQSLGFYLSPRYIHSRRDGPLRVWPHEICRVDVARIMIAST